MTTKRLIREVESAAYRSWPAGEVVDYDGWQLRYSDGFSRRGNSVYPAAESTILHEEKLGWCQDWYRQRGLDLVVRQTPASEPGLDQVLADRGFALEGRTNVMIAEIGAVPAEHEVTAAPDKAWWQTMADLWGIGSDRAPGWSAIVERIDLPAGFALVAVDGTPIAAGLAVVDAALLGLFEIIVAPAQRRQGVGIALARSLMAWGRNEGATKAYLQVVEENTPAIAMYEGTGFRHEYTYWYRRAPSEQPSTAG